MVLSCFLRWVFLESVKRCYRAHWLHCSSARRSLARGVGYFGWKAYYTATVSWQKCLAVWVRFNRAVTSEDLSPVLASPLCSRPTDEPWPWIIVFSRARWAILFLKYKYIWINSPPRGLRKILLETCGHTRSIIRDSEVSRNDVHDVRKNISHRRPDDLDPESEARW